MSGPDLRCEDCGEPIGVYEPVVLFDGLNAHLTSRAAIGPDCLAGHACFHAECYRPGEEDDRAWARDA